MIDMRVTASLVNTACIIPTGHRLQSNECVAYEADNYFNIGRNNFSIIKF